MKTSLRSDQTENNHDAEGKQFCNSEDRFEAEEKKCVNALAGG